MNIRPAVKLIALLVRFLLELAAFGALLWADWAMVGGFAGALTGLAALVVAVVAWGLFVAPRARILLPTPARLAIEVAVFGAACAALLGAGHPVLAALLGVLYLTDRLALWAVGEPVYPPPPPPRPTSG